MKHCILTIRHHFRLGYKLLGIVLMMFITFSVSGQSLSDIQNLKVDNLSDAQIEQLIKKAEASGLTSGQLESLARERGMPASEVSKLRQRINDLQNYSNLQGDQKTGGNRTLEFGTSPDMFDSLRLSDPYYDLTPTQKKIFGFKLFHNRNLDFNPSLNLPTPQNYVVGSGDQLLVDVYGASQQSFDLTVSPEGMVLIPNLGPVQVGGSNIDFAYDAVQLANGTIIAVGETSSSDGDITENKGFTDLLIIKLN